MSSMVPAKDVAHAAAVSRRVASGCADADAVSQTDLLKLHIDQTQYSRFSVDPAHLQLSSQDLTPRMMLCSAMRSVRERAFTPGDVTERAARVREATLHNHMH